MTGAPRPVAVLDATLRGALRDYHRTRWYGMAGVVALLAAGVIVLSVLYIGQDARLRASCEFWRALTTVPVQPAPHGPASKLAVTIVAGTRDAYAGQGCGRLPPADPSVRRWASFYHIRVP